MGGPHTESAGTSEIAQDSGGDSMSVDDAAALQTTLERIRQRYALHFFVPENARAGEERQIEVQLSATARRRYPDAQLRFRHSYIAPTGSGGPGKSQDPDSLITTREPDAVPAAEAPNVSVTSSTPAKHRRVISEPDGPSGPAASTSDGPTPP